MYDMFLQTEIDSFYSLPGSDHENSVCDFKIFFARNEVCLFIPWITGSLLSSMLYFQEIDKMANRIETIAEPPDGGVKVRPHQGKYHPD